MVTVYNIMIAFFRKGLTLDWASSTVRVGRMRGVPDPLTDVDENTPEFPAITYSYYITYDFFSHQEPVEQVMYPSFQTF